MPKFIKCIHGGGNNCRKYGGTGETVHGPNYLHKHLDAQEFETPPNLGRLPPTHLTLSKNLDYYFEDEQLAVDILSTAYDSISKALYHFNFDEIDGIERVVELLPVLDDQIVRDIYSTVFPNYPSNDDEHFNLRMARLELRGFFIDYMVTNGQSENTEEYPEDTVGKEAIDSGFSDETRIQSPEGEGIDEPGNPD